MNKLHQHERLLTVNGKKKRMNGRGEEMNGNVVEERMNGLESKRMGWIGENVSEA